MNKTYKREYINKFIDLLTKYPEHEVVVLIGNETYNDDYNYSLGCIDESRVDKCVTYNEETFFKSKPSYLIEKVYEEVCEEYQDDEVHYDNDDFLTKESDERIKRLEWVDCIVLTIEIP